MSSDDAWLARRIRKNIVRLQEAIAFQTESIQVFSRSKASGSKEAARLARRLLAKYKKDLAVEKALYRKLTGRSPSGIGRN